MLVPGLVFGAGGRCAATIGAATVATFISQGFGFILPNLAIDTDAPAGSSYNKGFRLNASGAVYGTTVQSATDQWVEGIRCSALGQIVYEAADADHFASGNPITPAGNFAVN
jgi:hypothetical protein